MICWHTPSTPLHDHRGHLRITYGVCRSRRGWLWCARILEKGSPPDQRGWSSTREQALAAASEAVVRIAGARDAAARVNHRWAQEQLIRPVGAHSVRANQATLVELKAAMMAAHPDRGGSTEAFIEARSRYVAARIKR